MMVLNKELVEQFVGITGCDEATATHMLEAYDNNLQVAVSEFLDGNLQTNGSSEKDAPKDHVRDPIPQTQGVLVDDYTSTSKWVPRRNRSVFGTLYSLNSSEGESNTTTDKKLKKLEDLFRPPVDITYEGTFQSARDEGMKAKKWLMVNIQNVTEFVCQALNRDVWSNKKVKALVKEHFIFWQEYSDSTEGERFMNFYSVTKWPHISILDPRTGGRLTNITDTKPESFIETVHLFLANHGYLDEDKVDKKFKAGILNSDEEAQLAAAIAASLEEKQTALTYFTDEESDFDSVLSSIEEEKEDREETVPSKSENSVNTEQKPCSNPQPVENAASPSKKTLTKIFPKKRKLDPSNSPSTSPSSLNLKRSRRTFDDEFPAEQAATTHCNGATQNHSPHRAQCRLLLKFPDGSREKISMNADDTIKDLIQVVSSKNYKEEAYELVTNFPRKNISTMHSNMTLRKAGLYPEDTIFIQEHL